MGEILLALRKIEALKLSEKLLKAEMLKIVDEIFPRTESSEEELLKRLLLKATDTLRFEFRIEKPRLITLEEIFGEEVKEEEDRKFWKVKLCKLILGSLVVADLTGVEPTVVVFSEEMLPSPSHIEETADFLLRKLLKKIETIPKLLK
jgi:hypothetical protein